jgi:hypothetical protein
VTSGGTEASGYTGSASSPVMMQDVVTLPGNGMTSMADHYTNGIWIPVLQSEAAASGVKMSVSGGVVTLTGTASAFDTLGNSGGDF